MHCIAQHLLTFCFLTQLTHWLNSHADNQQLIKKRLASLSYQFKCAVVNLICAVTCFHFLEELTAPFFVCLLNNKFNFLLIVTVIFLYLNKMIFSFSLK